MDLVYFCLLMNILGNWHFFLKEMQGILEKRAFYKVMFKIFLVFSIRAVYFKNLKQLQKGIKYFKKLQKICMRV